MRSLDIARDTCDKYHPGLLSALEEEPLLEREAPGSAGIATLRAHGGGALLVPPEFGGLGAGPLDAVRVQRAIGSVSPSLGAAVTMHHFTCATLFRLISRSGRVTEAQRDVLTRIAPQNLLMASGWAEGRTGQNIFKPSVVAHPDGAGDWILEGSKKPCSLSGSMDLLTASIGIPTDGADTADSLALALIPAGGEGMSVHPFWGTSVLAASESNEVRLEGVRLSDDLVLRVRENDPEFADDLADAGVVWFEMLISSVYAGAASNLAARVLEAGKGSATERATLAVRIESAVALLEGAARSVDDGLTGDEAVAAVLVARFACQDILAAAVDLAVEVLGGMSFVRSSEVATLSSTVRALAFHPPSRAATAEPLADYFAGAPLVLT